MSRELLAKAHRSLAEGDLIQASEKGWGAAAEAVKAVAEARGWPGNSHTALFGIVNRLVAETGDRRIGLLFATANALHQNSYENWMPAETVQLDLTGIDEFVTKVGSLAARPIQDLSGTGNRTGDLLRKARADLGAGNLVQASAKVWGAAVQALTDVAEGRGWPHENQGALFRVADRIAAETGDKTVHDLVLTASALDQNCHENWMTAEDVERGIERVAELVAKLGSLVAPPRA